MLSKQGKDYWALSKNCQTFLFSDNAFSCSKQSKDIKTHFYRLDFIYKKYTAQRVASIFKQAQSYSLINSTYCANFDKKLL